MDLLSDVRYAWRQLRKSPAFTMTAVLTLALGIAATTAVFSVTERVLIAPLPYREAGRIVSLQKVYGKESVGSRNVSGPDFLDLQAQTPSFARAAYYHGGGMGVQLPGHAVFTGVQEVSQEFPAIFGVTPLAGALFGKEGAAQQALVSAAFARDNFGSVEAAVGKQLSVEARAFTITGVLPAEFDFPARTSVWVGGPATPESMERTANNYHAVALLQAGVQPAEATAQLGALSARLAHAYGASLGTVHFTAVPLKETLTGKVRASLLLLLAAVGLVLLIVCVNIAHLQLARGAGRIRETAVRAALGAPWGRILREHAAEALLLAMAGGGLGLLLAAPLLHVLLSMAPEDLPRMEDIHLDLVVAGFCFAASVLTMLLTALAPAWQAMHTDPAAALKLDSLRTGGAQRAGSMRAAMMATEVALTFTLAIAAGLVLRTLQRIAETDPGYQTANRLVMTTDAPAGTEAQQIHQMQQIDRLIDQLTQIPGVEQAAGIMGLPSGNYGSNGFYAIPDKGQVFGGAGLKQADFNAATPAYFSTMGIPLLRGRSFDHNDTLSNEPVAIISKSLARASFGAENPIGHTIQCGLDELSLKHPARIIGVVGDVRQNSPAEQPGPALYMPLDQHPYRANEIEIVMQTRVPAASLIDTIQQKTNSFDPEIATRFTSMDETVAASTAVQRFRTLLLGSFAALGLLLAIAGVFSVMSYTVAQRRLEFGIRMALGAARTALLRLVLRQALGAAAVGVAAGLISSSLLGRVMESMLYGVSDFDPLTYGVAVALLFAAVGAAAYWPARRAASIEPMEALRTE